MQSVVRIESWRQRALNLLLIAVSGAAVPPLAFLLWEAVLDPRQWPAVIAYGALYGLILLLALLRRLPFQWRAWGFIIVGYAVAAIALARGGLMGDGRLYLLILPVMTWFLLGLRFALVTTLISALEYSFFALAAAQGWLAQWLVRTDNSLLPIDWLAAGVSLLLGLVAVNVLLLEYNRFQGRLLGEARALQARYQAFTEANLAGIYVLQEGVIRYINPALCRMLGYREDEVVGQMGVDELIHPEDREMVRENIRRRLNGEPVGNRYLLRALRKDGSTLYCEVLARQIEYEGRPAILGTVLDVTDRVEAFQRLERQVARLTLLKEIARRISELNPPDMVMARAVHLLVETFGYHHAAIFVQDPKTGDLVMRARAGQFVDLFPSDHRLAPGEGMVGWVAQNGQTLLANDVAQEPRYVNRYPDRIPTRAELTVPLRWGEQVIGVLDVQSPQRDAFTEDDVRTLETLADQLAVALRNAYLYEEQQRMERQIAQTEKLTALGRLAASLAHEINNPLQVIQAHLELALERPVWRQEEREGLEIALQHTRRLAETAQRALGLARPSDGPRQEVRPRELVTQSLLLVRHRLEGSNVQVEIDVPESLPPLRVVPNDILQVLVNLILNGIEAMPDGGCLRIAAGAGDTEVWLRVTSGCASHLPPDMGQLFEPFFTTKPDGVGLGLAISRQIVERYGGQITAQNSGDGQGLSFTVYLPVEAERP